ncbi:MAG: terpene cyclase/mutase family protein [Planctomycetia bacterium]|nr:terpene cyclase/mutase family protein [Planctomycetia bacterium]
MTDPFKKPARISLRPITPDQKNKVPDPEKLRLLQGKNGDVKDLVEEEKVPLGRRMSSWLFSFTVHVILMIILALIIFPPDKKPLTVEGTFSEELGDQLEIFTKEEGNINPVTGEEYKLEFPQEARLDDSIMLEKPLLPQENAASSMMLEQTRIELKDMLSGRVDPGTKNDLIAKYGGNQTTQSAVRRGLAWMAKQQNREGWWSLKGPYRDGLSDHMPENKIAATALALLAFQGDGNTRSKGQYAKEVKKGWSWLARQQTGDGLFFKDLNSSANDRFYTHAISLIALCEIIVLENIEKQKNEDLRGQAVKAIEYLKNNQNEELGGWRYEPGVDSDLSVTGWCLMALQTAKMAQIEVPETMLREISRFLDRVALEDGSRYVYTLPANVRRITPSMTATGLLCRMYLGWDRNNPAIQKGAEYLTGKNNLIHYPEKKEDGAEDRRSAPEYTNVYGWYSASMMLKHLGPYHKYWRIWNKAMCAEIPAHQIPEGKAESGSWDPEFDEYKYGGGRLYITAMSILCLEVYYRHLAIYK